MSYELMSDERLRDELEKIQAVINERSKQRAAIEAEQEKQQERLKRDTRQSTLASMIADYKKLSALCENPIEIRNEFAIPVHVTLSVLANADSEPDEHDYDDFGVVVKIPNNGKIPEGYIETIEEILEDTFRDFDYETAFKFFGEGRLQEINTMKRNLQAALDQTSYDWTDLTDAIAELDEENE